MIATDLFRNETHYESFPAGQAIFREGDEGHVMYVVLEGKVRLLIKNQLIEEVGPGGLFGEMALIDTMPRSATALAGNDCKLAPVTEKRFSFLVQQTPNFALHVMRVLATD